MNYLNQALRGTAAVAVLSGLGLVSLPAPACSPSSTEAYVGERDSFIVGALPAPTVAATRWVEPKSSGGCGGDAEGCSFATIDMEIQYGRFDYAAVYSPELVAPRYFRPASVSSSGVSTITFGGEESQWFQGTITGFELSVVVDGVVSESVPVTIPPRPRRD